MLSEIKIGQIVPPLFHKLLLSTLDTLSVIRLTLFRWIYYFYLVLSQRKASLWLGEFSHIPVSFSPLRLESSRIAHFHVPRNP